MVTFLGNPSSSSAHSRLSSSGPLVPQPNRTQSEPQKIPSVISPAVDITARETEDERATRLSGRPLLVPVGNWSHWDIA